ncbi:MAG: succinate dehydrogenase, hydrophobic membrane anchor protein [Gammaproteobacteria bacterium]|nr:succinate dehydrogenase, hydrophobic membrane anchor protein [Gammaproteobacteria bacterium]MDE0191417.1 succinate dehydrogenase, hydrophobic membrane anchor protein [Gammaproteobacteria bacterium]
MALVTNVTSFGRSGLADFVLQRVSAVVLGLYGLCLVGFFAVTPNVDHAALVGFLDSLTMKAFTTLAVVALAMHAWIGMWTVGTDYVRRHYFGRGHTVYLATYQVICLGAIFVYVLWPLSVVWQISGS